MSIEINNKNLSKIYIGTPPTDATKIAMSKTDTKTIADVINENKDNITMLNQSLSQEITNRQNEDEKKLPLTGGTLSGDVSIRKESYPSFTVATSTGSYGYMQKADNGTIDSGTLIGDIDKNSKLVQLYLQANVALERSIMLWYGTTASSGGYKIYGQHNITCSNVDAGALAEGCIHFKY